MQKTFSLKPYNVNFDIKWQLTSLCGIIAVYIGGRFLWTQWVAFSFAKKRLKLCVRPERRPTLERSTFLRHISGALQHWKSLHPRERSRFVEQSVVALSSFGHVTSAQMVTLFSSVAILRPWEQFLSSSGALPWVQKLRAFGRDPGSRPTLERSRRNTLSFCTHRRAPELDKNCSHGSKMATDENKVTVCALVT